MKKLQLFVSFFLYANFYKLHGRSVKWKLMDDGMYHDTLYLEGSKGLLIKKPPQLGNSTLLYFGTDSNGFQNPFALIRVSSNI
ncbi:MAG: hypothetical protein CM1200mP10_14940 [Candidatus Neomarinimicrobiota bacterium]|nr:MAG: hypothetical protein CM1200mP10_14940 [Candidatus Neomarinimicrobiota bacterium]